MEKTLREVGAAPVRRIKFKSYTISDIPNTVGEIPPSFDKHKTLHFKKNGLTYIEKVDSFWNYI